jgi:hypothetical protein
MIAEVLKLPSERSMRWMRWATVVRLAQFEPHVVVIVFQVLIRGAVPHSFPVLLYLVFFFVSFITTPDYRRRGLMEISGYGQNSKISPHMLGLQQSCTKKVKICSDSPSAPENLNLFRPAHQASSH